MKYEIRYINNPKINSLLSSKESLYRPVFFVRSILFSFLCFFLKSFLLSSAFYYSFSFYFEEPPHSFFLVYLGALVFCFAATQKRLAIFCIHLYQRFAPYYIRLKCCCLPSCSQYTIIAIQKYGLLIGVLKGFIHYRRCKPPGVTGFP